MNLYRESFFLFTCSLTFPGLAAEEISRSIFILFPLICLGFVLFKIGVTSPDARSYLDLLSQIRNDDLPVVTSGGDFSFYDFTHVLSFRLPDKVVINFVVIVGAALELVVIVKLTKFSMLAFAFLVSLSSQVADLTSISNSLAAAIVCVSIYFPIKKEFKKSVSSYFAVLIAHLNAVLIIF